MSQKSYMDIGHGDPDSKLWLYANGSLDVRKTGSRTHEKIWGFDAMRYWRGRYDPKTDEISVASPVQWKGNAVPQYLLDALEAEFGKVLEIYHFNPSKPGKRIK